VPQCLYSTAITLLHLRAVRPVQSLSACTVQLYLYSPYEPYALYTASVPVQVCTLPLTLYPPKITSYVSLVQKATDRIPIKFGGMPYAVNWYPYFLYLIVNYDPYFAWRLNRRRSNSSENQFRWVQKNVLSAFANTLAPPLEQYAHINASNVHFTWCKSKGKVFPSQARCGQEDG